MCKEAHFSLTLLPILACFGSIPRRVQPALKHAVSELAAITTAAPAAAVLRTHSPGVVIPPRVPAPGLLARMCERTVGPVVAAAASAPTDLEFVHPEVVGGVRVIGFIVVGGVGVCRVVVREEFLEDGVVGEHVGGAVVCGGDTAGEEFPWWDVNLS